jgi:hypothetical protein
MFSLAMQNHSMKDDTMQFVAVVVLPDEVPVSTHNVPACTVPTLVDTTAVQVVANAPVRTPEPATHLVWFSHNPHRHRAFCWCMGTKNHHQCYNYTLHHSPPNQHGTCRRMAFICKQRSRWPHRFQEFACRPTSPSAASFCI